jgi:hypothetical protein
LDNHAEAVIEPCSSGTASDDIWEAFMSKSICSAFNCRQSGEWEFVGVSGGTYSLCDIHAHVPHDGGLEERSDSPPGSESTVPFLEQRREAS